MHVNLQVPLPCREPLRREIKSCKLINAIAYLQLIECIRNAAKHSGHNTERSNLCDIIIAICNKLKINTQDNYHNITSTDVTFRGAWCIRKRAKKQ